MTNTTTASAASATVDPDHFPPLRLDSIPTIDLRLLSQSDLYSLSISSNSSFDLNRCDDVVIPKINRSVFNESAGSRKQTYSRLRLAPAESSTSTKTTIHRRTPHIRASHARSSNNINDPEQAENSQIIRMLKELFKSDPNFEDLVPIEVENDSNVVVPELLNTELKRKRGRPRKLENAVFISPPVAKRMRNDTVKKVVVYDNDRDREIVNSRGVKVNLDNLGGLEDPYGSEISRRTEGMSTADELLGFLRCLKGQWGTTRKKKKVVDASDFGDALPKGWKLSLAIKKKEGRAWLFCRRYISPSGRQFESCKEVSKYLLSVVGEENLDKRSHTHSNDGDDYALKEALGNAEDADLYVQEDLKTYTPVHNPSASPISMHTDTEKTVDPVTNENKTYEASETPTAKKTIEQELPASISIESNAIRETHEANASCQSDKTDELVHDLNILAHGNQPANMIEDILVEDAGDGIGNKCNVDYKEVSGTDKTPDVSVSKSDFSLGHEASICINESNGKFESSGGTVDSVDTKLEYVLDQGTNSGGYLFSPLSNKESGGAIEVVEKDIVGMSNVQDAVSGTAVTHVDDEPECILGEPASVEVLNDMHICSSFDELTSEKEKVVNSESSSRVFHSRLVLDDDCLAEAKKLSDSESLSLFSPSNDTIKAVNNASLISSKKQESPQKAGFAGSTSVDQVTQGFDENGFSYGVTRSKLNGQYEVRNSAFDSYNMSSMDGVTNVDKEDNFKSHSSVSSWHENKHVNEDVGRKFPVSMSKETFHIENNVKNASSNDFQFFRNNESINNEVASLGSSRNGLNNAADVIDFNTGKNLEFCSLVPPVNEQAFGFQDDVTGLYDSNQESSERGLLDHFCVAETAEDDIFGNKMYSTPLDGLKFDEVRGDIGIHDLSLAFGNPHALYAENTINLEHKKDGVSCSVVPSKIDDVQTDLSMVNKRGRDSVGLSSYSQHNGNSVSPGRTWEDFRSNEFRNSENNKLMMGSGSKQHQHNELVDPHSAQIQPPSSFHSFDIMPNKAEDGMFRLDGRYNDDGGFRSGRSEPVEFRFLAGRSEHDLQGGSGSRVFPYNTGMEQTFDSSFWMGKNGMMPNMGGGRNVITSVCAWCRNEFHLHQETQPGVASLCPACTAGYSGQVNML